MASRYFVRNAVVTDVPEIPITEGEFICLEVARNVLSTALAIEEKYSILLSNLLEFETELLRASAYDMLFEGQDYPDFFDTRSALNTRIVNLLTAAKLYVDQARQDVAECLNGNADAENKIARRFTEEYDSCFEYQFMEALRNHVQHRGIPIHLVKHPRKWTSIHEDGMMEFSIDCFSEKRYLAENRKFKKQVLEKMPDRVNLKAAARRYVESLSAVHSSARELITEKVTSSRQEVEDIIHRYRELNSGDVLGLAAYKVSDDGQQLGYVPLLLEWDDVRKKLLGRNRRLVNLSKRYVTGFAAEDRG